MTAKRKVYRILTWPFVLVFAILMVTGEVGLELLGRMEPWQ
jgi:hypothetical protein